MSTESLQVEGNVTGSEAPVEETQEEQRPEWLPEKFKNPQEYLDFGSLLGVQFWHPATALLYALMKFTFFQQKCQEVFFFRICIGYLPSGRLRDGRFGRPNNCATIGVSEKNRKAYSRTRFSVHGRPKVL